MKKIILIISLALAACATQATTNDDGQPFTKANPDPVDGCYPMPKYDYGCEHEADDAATGNVYAWECDTAGAPADGDGTPSDEEHEGNCFRIGYENVTNYAWCCTDGE